MHCAYGNDLLQKRLEKEIYPKPKSNYSSNIIESIDRNIFHLSYVSLLYWSIFKFSYIGN